MLSAALQSLSSHLPGCGAGLALAALVGWVGSAPCSALVRLLRLAGGECWAPALRLLAVWPPGCCMGPVGACVGPLPGTTSCPALAGHVAGSRLGATGAVPPALLGASSLHAGWAAHGPASPHMAACHSLLR
ncbi:hypothetical protein HaLaN_01504 [Haematococcus lacustris]|uniref:Uncharacterized protein n=1 Tax=Haematococcus lacustris TaxID=44745 RepID=A0A699YII8_HAELA|nr:hypothetical protein HaLaN_01504 [Haematococcus lacustris]